MIIIAPVSWFQLEQLIFFIVWYNAFPQGNRMTLIKRHLTIIRKIGSLQNTQQTLDLWKVQFSSASKFRKISPFQKKASTIITCIPPDPEAAALTCPTVLPSFVSVYWSLLFLLKPFSSFMWKCCYITILEKIKFYCCGSIAWDRF